MATKNNLVEFELVLRAESVGIPAAETVQRALNMVWQLNSGPENITLCVVFMHEEEHSLLHDQFLNDPSATDVMAFPYQDDDLFGEILINVDMAERQAPKHRQTFQEEVLLYIVHGALHLIGFDDICETTRKEMRLAESKVMRALCS